MVLALRLLVVLITTGVQVLFWEVMGRAVGIARPQ